MTLQIYDEATSAYVDILPYIKVKGLKWKRADVEGEEATRNLDGSLTRDRRAIKIRLDITCRPLTATEAETLLKLIRPVTVNVSYTDPMLGATVSNFYSNNIPASYLMQRGGVDYWEGIEFPLIEM